MSQMIRCKHCHRWVRANPRIKDQQFCGRKKCQRARKAEWQRNKQNIDPQYKANQDDAKAKWRRKNPGYSKQYRDANPKYCDRNRQLQKKRDLKRRNKTPSRSRPETGRGYMDASMIENILNTVCYNESTGILAKMDASIQLIVLKPEGYIILPKNIDLAKMDASTDKFIIIPSIYADLAKMDNIDRRKLPPYGDGIIDNRDPFQKGG